MSGERLNPCEKVPKLTLYGQADAMEVCARMHGFISMLDSLHSARLTTLQYSPHHHNITT